MRPDQAVVGGKQPPTLSTGPLPVSLPAGVEMISVEEVQKLVSAGDDLMLVDTRPGSRYRRSHLPGAISLPAAGAAENIDRLPTDRDRLLIFYGEGPT